MTPCIGTVVSTSCERSGIVFSEGHPGCIVEITVLRKPVSLGSRLGMALFPRSPLRSTQSEAALFREIDRDFQHGNAARQNEMGR